MIYQTNFDGNISCSSTFGVENSKAAASTSFQLVLEPDEECKRRVSFNETRNRYFKDEVKTLDESSSSWYDEDDYMVFEAETHHSIENASNSDFSSILKTLYENVSKGDMTADEEDALVRAIQENTDFIGLEYYATKSITKDARARREFIQDIVADFDPEDEAEDLGESCRRISRVSSLFAQLLAKSQVLV